jgi:hypothetical protein
LIFVSGGIIDRTRDRANPRARLRGSGAFFFRFLRLPS